MFDRIDFKDCEILYRESSCTQKEDLLQLKCRNGKLIDVGWYGCENQYCILVIENENWDFPCYKIEQQPKLEYIEHHLQKIIDYETTIFTQPAQILLNKITAMIEHWGHSDIHFDRILKPIKQLYVLGLTQKEVTNYIEIYALKYNDGFDIRWDLACDILDRVTGFCAPELRLELK